MIRGLIAFGALVITLILLFGNTEKAFSKCVMSYCKKDTAPKRSYITKTSRQVVGDLYSPGTGRIQIRDTSRRIIGYVERSGRITNTRRQKIGEINE